MAAKLTYQETFSWTGVVWSRSSANSFINRRRFLHWKTCGVYLRWAAKFTSRTWKLLLWRRIKCRVCVYVEVLCMLTASFWMNSQFLWLSWKSADEGSILRLGIASKNKKWDVRPHHWRSIGISKYLRSEFFAEALELQKVIARCLLFRAPTKSILKSPETQSWRQPRSTHLLSLPSPKARRRAKSKRCQTEPSRARSAQRRPCHRACRFKATSPSSRKGKQKARHLRSWTQCKYF